MFAAHRLEIQKIKNMFGMVFKMERLMCYLLIMPPLILKEKKVK